MPPEDQSNQPLPNESLPMDLPKKRNTGLVIVIILIIILAIGSVAGVWYWQTRQLNAQKAANQQKVNDLQNQIQQLQADNAAMKAQLAIDATTQAAISKTIKGFYDDWLKGISATPPVAKGTLATQEAAKGYITSNVVSYINSATGSDPVICAQNVPQSYTYANLTLNNKIAGAVVTFTFSSGTSKATLELTPNGNNWQISKISCPQQ